MPPSPHPHIKLLLKFPSIIFDIFSAENVKNLSKKYDQSRVIVTPILSINKNFTIEYLIFFISLYSHAKGDGFYFSGSTDRFSSLPLTRSILRIFFSLGLEKKKPSKNLKIIGIQIFHKYCRYGDFYVFDHFLGFWDGFFFFHPREKKNPFKSFLPPYFSVRSPKLNVYSRK